MGLTSPVVSLKDTAEPLASAHHKQSHTQQPDDHLDGCTFFPGKCFLAGGGKRCMFTSLFLCSPQLECVTTCSCAVRMVVCVTTTSAASVRPISAAYCVRRPSARVTLARICNPASRPSAPRPRPRLSRWLFYLSSPPCWPPGALHHSEGNAFTPKTFSTGAPIMTSC